MAHIKDASLVAIFSREGGPLYPNPLSISISALNSTGVTLSSLAVGLNGVVIPAEVTGASLILNGAEYSWGDYDLTNTATYTFDVCARKQEDGDTVYVSEASAFAYTLVEPSVNFTTDPNSLSGVGDYSRTYVISALSGSFDLDLAATDWNVDGTETLDTSSLLVVYPDTVTQYTIAVSGYDISGNFTATEKTGATQTISGLMVPTSDFTDTIVDPTYLATRFYIINTTDITLSSYEYSIDGSGTLLNVGDIAPYETTFINPQFNNPLTIWGVHTVWVSGYQNETADCSVVSGTITLATPVAPSVDFTITPDSLTGIGVYSRQYTISAVSGTYALDLTATNWDLDGVLDYNSESVVWPFASDIDGTYPITMSGYDINGNGTRISKNQITQSISSSLLAAESSVYFETVANTPEIVIEPILHNTTDLTLSAYQYRIDTTYDDLCAAVIAPRTLLSSATELTVTSPGVKTIGVTGWASGLADYDEFTHTGEYFTPVAPTASLSSNTLSADEPFTASFVVATTAGTWSVQSSATDWDFGDGFTSADGGMSLSHSYTPDTSADSWTISVSAYDQYYNVSNISTWTINDTWNEADRLAEGNRKWMLGYGKGEKGVPLSEL